MKKGRSVVSIVQKYHPHVTKVVDARAPAVFEVSERDCKQSRRKAPDKCALAQACERSFDGAIISMSTAYLVKGTTAYRYEVPVRIARELVSFDRHHDFAPGTYWLNAPSPSFRLGSDRRKRKGPEPEREALGPIRRHAKTERVRSL